MTSHSSSFFKCGRWDLNPHERNAHKILSLARLPVPTLPHDRISLGFFIFSLATYDSITKVPLYVNTFFLKNIKNIFYLYNWYISFNYKGQPYQKGRPLSYFCFLYFVYMDQSKIISAINTRSVSPVFVRPCPFPSGVIVISPAFTGRFTPLSSYSPSPLKI